MNGIIKAPINKIINEIINKCTTAHDAYYNKVNYNKVTK